MPLLFVLLANKLIGCAEQCCKPETSASGLEVHAFRLEGGAFKMRIGLNPSSRVGAAAMVVLFLLPPAHSQTGSSPHLMFDAASIKVDDTSLKTHKHGGPGTDDPGRFTYTHVPVEALVYLAYDMNGDQVLGAEKLPGTSFALVATMPPTTTKEQFRAMLQNLLADRFHLVVHHEARVLPCYDLVVAAGEPRFHAWVPDPNAPPRAIVRALQPGQSGLSYSFSARPPLVHVTNRQSMSDFAAELQILNLFADNTRENTSADDAPTARDRLGSLPRFIDRTALTGLFEFMLDFEGAQVPTPSAGGTTLFEALHRQLGLKVIKAKAPVDVLVIDRADKLPSEN